MRRSSGGGLFPVDARRYRCCDVRDDDFEGVSEKATMRGVARDVEEAWLLLKKKAQKMLMARGEMFDDSVQNENTKNAAVAAGDV